MNSLLLCLLGLATAPLHSQSPGEIDAYLSALHGEDRPYLERFQQVVRDSVGTPYEDGPLGEGPGAPYDDDPLIVLSKVDCVTFVEQSAALALGADYADVTDKLQQVRYKNGEIDFARRNHFFVAEWVPNNPWCRDISDQLGVPTETVTRTISKADFFKLVDAPDVGQDIADRTVSVRYIPIDNVAAAVKHLDKPALVVFVGNVDWLFALHCGVYLPGGESAGDGALYHASSKAGSVAAMDLAAYAAEQSSRYLGITVYEITPPVLPATKE